MFLSISPGGAHERAVQHALVRRAADIQFLREHLSSNALEIALFKLGMANSSDPHVRRFSKTALAAHLKDENDSVKLAAMEKIRIKMGINDSEDGANYKRVLRAVNTSNFDQVYLTTLQSINQVFTMQNDDQIAMTANARFRNLATQDLDAQHGDLAAVKVFLGI